MSSLRRPPGPVRQLSLQQPPRRQQVRRQRSAEDEKPLQVFANPIRTRLQCQDGKGDLDRPKVRVAWDENPESVSNGVAVIARQIPGKLRPPTAKTKVTTRPVVSEKASILYSRQELAERLRLAWKQREENRANIDIFLAHNAVESNCESRPSSCATSAPSGRRKGPNPRVIVNEPQAPPVVSSTSIRVTSLRQEPQQLDVKSSDRVISAESMSLGKVEHDEGGKTGLPISSGVNILLSEDLPARPVQEKSFLNESSVRFPEEGRDQDRDDQEEMDSLDKDLRAEEDAVRDITLGDWPPCPSLPPKEKKMDQDGEPKDSVPSAKTKRANFSNHSGNSNKVFTSGPLPTTVSDRREKPNSFSKDQQHSTGLPIVDGKTRRTNSAPPQQRRQASSSLGGPGRTQVSIVIDTPSIGPTAPSQEMKSEVVSTTASDVLAKSISNRAIKSAPMKRRAKSGKRRVGLGGSGGGIRADGGEEDVQNDGKSRRSGARGSRPLLQTKVPDVVTMVSLVSSADSDSDIDQNSPRDDKLIHELRNKLPTTPIIKTSSGCPAIAVLRKPIKSVSFQQESFDCEKDETPKEDRRWGVGGVFGQQRFPVVCRSGGSALPTPEEATSWKTEDTIPPLLVARNESKEPEDPLIAPVTDREKRCLAVPIGDPIRDKKRRLLRTRSTPPRPYIPDERLNSPVRSPPESTAQISRTRDHEASNDKTTTSDPSIPKAVDRRNSETEIGSEPEPETGLTSSEPQFQTRKERECWHLYRRMCDKGVYVSFDTVLRGMLTPTEYRLRQKEAAPDC